MPPCRRQSAGFSLIELLIVIAVLGILASLVLPSSQPSLHDQLRSTAQIFRTDLAYGRSLAVGNNSTYRITFDVIGNRYVLEHTGSNADLDTLPDSPFRQPEDPPTQHLVDLDELPHVGPTVRLVAAASFDPSPTPLADSEPVADVEFGPLGETTRSRPTIIWMATGRGPDTRYLSLVVNPVTGLVEIGDYTSTGPPSELIPAASPPP